MTITKKTLTILAAVLMVSSWYCNALAQSESDYALVQIPFFSDPIIWNLNKFVTNAYLEVDLFGKPRAASQSYVYHPSYGLLSGMSFQIDRDWDRLVYWECLDYWIRAYGSHGSSGCQFWSPSSIEAFAPCNDQVYPSFYRIYVGDQENDRIVRLTYDWDCATWTCNQPAISGSGLERPRDFSLNNNYTFWPETGDYLWVISGQDVLKRFECDGTYKATHDYPGCDGEPGTWCRLTAVASGRSVNAPDPYANTTRFFVADAGNRRIVWLIKITGSETISWFGEVPTSSSIVDLEVDNFGQLWALDGNTGIVTKYTDDLFPLCTYGNTGSHNRFFNPVNISNTGGYLASGVVVVTESWSDTSGFLRFAIGTDIVDFSINPTKNDHWLYISYTLVDPSDVTAKIYNQQGGLVKTVFDGQQFSGACYFIWTGTDNAGQPVPTGNYRLELVSTCAYYSTATGLPVNVVTKEEWFYHSDYLPGDIDNSGSYDVSDLVWLVDYMFLGGLPPIPYLCVGDIDASGAIDIGDLLYLVDWLFIQGDPPLDGCRIW